MKLVDTHCHLQAHAFDEDREEVIQRSLETLDWLVVVGDDIATSQAAVALARPGVYAAVGVHPYHAQAVNDNVIAELREVARQPGVVALGEFGLDYYKYSDTPRETQEEAFRRQLELAAELQLPVVIHNRDAQDDIIRVIDEYASGLAGGIMHCFSGDAALAAKCAQWGFHVSFAGNVTFPKAQPLRDVAATISLDKILVETDSPYLAPQPVRGKRCEPHWVLHTAKTLAEVMDVDFDAFVRQTTENASALFQPERARAALA